MHTMTVPHLPSQHPLRRKFRPQTAISAIPASRNDRVTPAILPWVALTLLALLLGASGRGQTTTGKPAALPATAFRIPADTPAEPVRPIRLRPASVRGRVTDPLGRPVMGAVVTLSGTGLETVTDAEGYFLLETYMLNDKRRLSIQYHGLKPLEREIEMNDFTAMGMLDPLALSMLYAEELGMAEVGGQMTIVGKVPRQ